MLPRHVCAAQVGLNKHCLGHRHHKPNSGNGGHAYRIPKKTQRLGKSQCDPWSRYNAPLPGYFATFLTSKTSTNPLLKHFFNVARTLGHQICATLLIGNKSGTANPGHPKRGLGMTHHPSRRVLRSGQQGTAWSTTIRHSSCSCKLDCCSRLVMRWPRP